MKEIHSVLSCSILLLVTEQVRSLKKPYFWTDCVGMAGSDVIGCTKGGAIASVKFISLVIPTEHNNLANTAPRCNRSQSLIVLSCVWEERGGEN